MSPVERELAVRRFASDAEVDALLTRQPHEDASAARAADRMVLDFKGNLRRAAEVARENVANCDDRFPETRVFYAEVARILECRFVQADLEAAGIRPRVAA